MLAKNFNTKFLQKIKFLRLKILCLRVSYCKRKKYEKKFILLQFTEERSRIRSWIRMQSRFLSQRYGSTDPDPLQKCHGSSTLVSRIWNLPTVPVCFLFALYADAQKTLNVCAGLKQCCKPGTGTVGTVTFCLSGSGTVINYGYGSGYVFGTETVIKWNHKSSHTHSN
jgi:hypothetical protein